MTVFGWQATGSTFAALRSIVHALRGWPTPLGAAINTAGGIFSGGVCTDDTAADQLALVGRQLAQFATAAVERQVVVKPLHLPMPEKKAIASRDAK